MAHVPRPFPPGRAVVINVGFLEGETRFKRAVGTTMRAVFPASGAQ